MNSNRHDRSRKDTPRVAVFANVLFEEFGNQSVRNFVEGLLVTHEVLFVTVATPTEYAQHFAAAKKGLRMEYVLHGSLRASHSVNRLGIGSTIRGFCKRVFAYRGYASNSATWQWLSVGNTVSTLRTVHRWIKAKRDELDACERWIFIDVFGGMLIKHLYSTDSELRSRIAGRTVGYYLGTVLTQFQRNALHALMVMPLSFRGSYRVPHDKLIITNDGTDGENQFRSWLKYAGPILFIRNGTDARLLAPHQLRRSENNNSIRFVVCARLTKWKRIDRIIRFVSLVRRYSSHSLRLTVIGDGEEKQALQALTCRTGIDDIARFTGGLKYEDALSEIAGHDYYAIFNDLSNLGNQVNESIVLGVVPITIDDGSTDSLLTNGVDSLKFPPGRRFEDRAAKLFIKEHSIERHASLQAALAETRKKLFSWNDRNMTEHKFIFLDSLSGPLNN